MAEASRVTKLNCPLGILVMNHLNPLAPPAPGEFVRVSGSSMHVLRRGNGSPTVVLESGAGGSVLEWAQVADGLCQDATVVMRDRPGFAWSEYAARDRSAIAAAKELRELLEALRIPPPFVLVGHSLGGLHVRAFAAMYPNEVSGMVLVDASHERIFDGEHLLIAQVKMFRWLIALRPLIGKERLRQMYRRAILSGDDRGEASPAKRIFETFDAMDRLDGPWFKGIRDEYESVLQSCEQIDLLRKNQPFPQVPLRVLSQGRISTSRREQALASRLRKLHADLASLSTDSRHIIAKNSGHLIQLDEPELVIAAVREVLRSNSRQWHVTRP